jgi:hypothetical protein
MYRVVEVLDKALVKICRRRFEIGGKKRGQKFQKHQQFAAYRRQPVYIDKLRRGPAGDRRAGHRP